mmetsp:Transcript_27671/g.77379  ORF Transcript_27671/g.77379 Transcript_27671/m.77379 type:complete len:249 (+) Transcript_27671:191-937(+)|eukprot:CAMPEP_0119123510 /NCGR_PEP_ID=MMETSP1310-20130426/3439_1 /TAXON_ID=464262 /ORGANISM="Genus nov. species nov., Strain RCC2339" /LENGTH=248 /DNA_ID=CAMNT_0007113347 /DNA_START=138 /DNA_END=884 /DNA_ORIENTATION=-
MEWLFGKKKTPEELLREHQRTLRRAIRDLDRERAALERQEKQLVVEIKKMAKQKQMGSCRILAKDLVRTRNHIQKFHEMKAELQAVNLRMQTLRSQAAMATAMKGVTKTMVRMNRQMKIPEMQRVMMEFEKQSDIMDMKEEMIAESMDGALDTDEDEAKVDTLVQKALDELGIDVEGKLADAPVDKLESVGVSNPKQKQAVADAVGGSSASGPSSGARGEGSIAAPTVSADDPDADLFARVAALSGNP